MENISLEYGKYNYEKIRMDHENSFFMNPFFDQAIMGVDRLTRSVIYSFDDLVQLDIYSRFENGELNPDFDDVDDDLLRIGRDTISHYFGIFQKVEGFVPPTLFEEFDRSKYDRNVNSEKSTSGDGKILPKGTIRDLKPRMFSHKQLTDISDENSETYTGWTNMTRFEDEHVFVLIPRRVLDYALEEGAEPCIRTIVTILDHPSEWISFQDMTFDQWSEGTELQETSNELHGILVNPTSVELGE